MSTDLHDAPLSRLLGIDGRTAVVAGAARPAQAVAEALRRAGASVTHVTLAGEASLEAVQSACDAAFGRLDALDILVLSIDDFFAAPLPESEPDELRRVLEANLMRPYAVLRAAAPHLRDGARVVAISNAMGERGVANGSAYGAAHAGLQQVVRAYAQEVAPRGITVNAIEQGWMEWMTDRLPSNDREAQRAARFPTLRRLGREADIIPVVLWLVSDAAGYATGQVFPVDGGLTQHL
jgi:NAD(P)-dependent dehydrogenase (short-subunit alcohol dehydrogenase family)